MYIRFALAILLLWGAGCSQDSRLGLGTSNRLGTGAAASGVASVSLRASPNRSRPFANLPDRGDLLAYPEQRVIRQDGAYTWHRAGLSEDHALRAVGGVMKVTTPLGERLQFQYERHVEHPSGDWTWIGRVKNGAASDEIVLTFGEKAAFGSIAQPGRAPLKLTMSGGTSWLIEIDRSKIAGIDNPATRPRSPDFLIPPKIKAAYGAAASTASSAPTAASSTASAQAAAATTVDVLLGYTSGFAAAQGGQSQALTRLNNMVEIANQAYTNSHMDARVRLVHAMQVNYPDNTSNDSALEALTGFRAPSTPTTPDPAFAALRAARNQYGADLVSLVRQFNTPENDGCGIAWLIGGGQSGIDSSDEYFGYSVVSDGRDAGTDGKTYFCREETLAHELGHNMGSQHDRATATVDGVLKYGLYPYSFGYKTAAGAGNFYTVMAYGDSGQATHRVFSNPNDTFCGGYACGIAGQADNALSLSQAMPRIAAFRATVVSTPAPRRFIANDVNGDGKSDFIWYNSGASALTYWIANATNVVRTEGFTMGGNYAVVSTGDYNGDGNLDLLLNRSQGDMKMWLGNSVGFSSMNFAQAPAGWTLVGSGDVDADNSTDLVWFHASSSTVAYWKLSGTVISNSRGFSVPMGSSVIGHGDYNGDNNLDLLIGLNTGQLQMWVGNGVAFEVTNVGAYPQGWTLIGSGDIDGDGKADLIWRHSAGQVSYWVLNGPTVVRSVGFALGADYGIVALGDYDGNGLLDLTLKAVGAAEMHMWLGQPNGGFMGWDASTYPTGWLPPPIH